MVGGSKGIHCGGKYADYTFIHTSYDWHLSIMSIQQNNGNLQLSFIGRRKQ